MFAKLVGEGYDNPNAGEVLDVNYSKVGEWLVDRRLIPQDWARKLQVIQAKAADAVKELPPGFLGQFAGGEDAPVDYFLAKEILAKLTETAERGLLGSLKGSAGTWEKIVKAYEANLLHAAEGGLTLARNVDYEVPYFKKQAAKNQQLMTDLDRRAADALKSAAAAAVEFQQELIAMGISPSATTSSVPGIKTALLGLTNELPELMASAVESLKSKGVGDAASYYAAFTAALAPAGASPSARAELATLSEVKEGRTEPPQQNRRPIDTQSAPIDLESSLAELDLAVGGGDALGAISWDFGGATVEDTGSAAAVEGISWDFEVETPAGVEGGGDDGNAPAPAGISWDIDISATGEESLATGDLGAADNTAAAAAEGTIAGVGVISSNGTAGSTDQLAPEIARLVADAAYRAQVLDDLFELRAFLMQRINELATGNQASLASAPAEVATVDSTTVAAMQSAVNVAIGALTEGRTMQLLSLASSGVHCDRLASKLARQGGQEAKFKRAAVDAEARKAEAQRQLVADSAKLAALVRRTREVKSGVEKALGTKLGRVVNVQGEINSVLA